MSAIKPRVAGTFSDAVSKIAGELSAAGAGEVIGVGRGRIYAATDPDQDNYSALNVEQALKLDVAFFEETGREGPILRAYRQQYDDAISGGGDGVPLVIRIGQIGKEAGEVIDRIAKSIDPNSRRGSDLSRREAVEVLKEISDLKEVIDATEKHVREAAGIEQAVPSPAETTTKAA